MAELLRGAPVAAALTEGLSLRAAALRERGVVPALAILRVGEREDDLAYESAAVKRCAKAGIRARQFVLPADCARERLLEAVREINEDETIHGCLMLRPLADREAEDAACAALDPRKDVDGMTAASQAAVYAGQGRGFPPCTAQAVLELLDHYGVELEGKTAVVVGRSLVVGRPLSMLLLRRGATVTLCHSATRDLPGICRRGDVLVAAAGRAGLITSEHTAPGQTVIDVGIHVGADGALCGDVDFPAAESAVRALTPVPGGVGAVTTAVLCKHVILAAEAALGS